MRAAISSRIEVKEARIFPEVGKPMPEGSVPVRNFDLL